MQRLLILLLSVFVLTVTACKSSKDLGDSSSPTQEKLDSSLLWQVEKNGISTSYVFGTIHMIDSEDYFLPNGTEAAIDQVDAMVFEINMDDMMDLGAQLSLLRKAFMPNGLKIRDLLEPEDYQLVKDFFDDMGLPMFMLEKIKPMFLSVFASMDMSEGGFDSGSWKSYEMEFHEMAKDRSLQIGGLETMEYQMAVFDSIPYKDQADMLVDMIKYRDTGNDEMDKLIAARIRHRMLTSWLRLHLNPKVGMADYEDILLKDRNENWIPVMTEYMTDGPTFFAVGAGHLGGEYGVIRLLRKAGFTVTAVEQGVSAPQGNKL